MAFTISNCKTVVFGAQSDVQNATQYVWVSVSCKQCKPFQDLSTILGITCSRNSSLKIKTIPSFFKLQSIMPEHPKFKRFLWISIFHHWPLCQSSTKNWCFGMPTAPAKLLHCSFWQENTSHAHWLWLELVECVMESWNSLTGSVHSQGLDPFSEILLRWFAYTAKDWGMNGWFLVNLITISMFCCSEAPVALAMLYAFNLETWGGSQRTWHPYCSFICFSLISFCLSQIPQQLAWGSSTIGTSVHTFPNSAKSSLLKAQMVVYVHW